jgi:hypothetical protein
MDDGCLRGVILFMLWLLIGHSYICTSYMYVLRTESHHHHGLLLLRGSDLFDLGWLDVY